MENFKSIQDDDAPAKTDQQFEENSEAPEKKGYQANNCFLVPYALVMNVGILQFGFLLSECN